MVSLIFAAGTPTSDAYTSEKLTSSNHHLPNQPTCFFESNRWKEGIDKSTQQITSLPISFAASKLESRLANHQFALATPCPSRRPSWNLTKKFLAHLRMKESTKHSKNSTPTNLQTSQEPKGLANYRIVHVSLESNRFLQHRVRKEVF